MGLLTRKVVYESSFYMELLQCDLQGQNYCYLVCV